MKIGTRGSELALAQARDVRSRLAVAGFDAEIVTITTTGDRREIPRDPAEIGKALWTREIEEALHEGSIDLAVHSLKDLPAELPEGLVIGAVLPREDPSDVLVSRGEPRTVHDLREGARVGTGSIRRAAALARARPDLDVVQLQGNVPTRLQRLEDGDFDAIVLAAAGLNRLGRSPEGLHSIDPLIMPPALCQGIVAVEVREGEVEAEWVTALNHTVTMSAMRAERALLAELEVGCGSPVGGLASVEGAHVTVYGEVLSVDGGRSVREMGEGRVADAASVGQAVGRALVEGEAGELLQSLRS